VLGEAKTRDAAIRNTATLLVPTAADCFVIFLAPEEGAPAVLEIKHVDESKGSALRARLRELLMPRAESAENDVRREAIALSASLMDEALQMSFASLGIAEGTVLPLSYGEQLRGFLLMVASMDRPDSAVDIEFCRSLAERFGLALEQSYLLRRAQLLSAARDRAVGIVSHDLGNSLSTIDICASALLDPDPPPEIEVRNMAELILRSVTWMRRIAADLLDNTSLEAGRLELDRHPTMVSDVVNATHAMFARAAEERELELVVEQSPDLPPVDADPDRLMQVLSNLVGNAVKFTPVGGRVVLSAKLVSDTPVDSNGEAREAPRSDARAEASVRFSVTDTGPGIAPEDLAHVFDWFWHARGFGHGGRGLGLAIARGLVEAHQQQLHVDSAPGRGSTFWFTMPVAQAGQRVRDDPVAAER
jgi:signal transduction histidine kinase